MLHGVGHQLLGRHVDHVVFPLDDAGQLQINPVLDNLGQFVPIQLVGLVVDQVFQLLRGVLQLGRKQTLGQRRNDIAHFCDVVGRLHNHLATVLLAQIGELLQHLVGGFQIDGQFLVRVGETAGV